MANFSDIPEERSIDAFMTALQSHNKVDGVIRREDSYIVDVQLSSGAEIVVFMTNIYVVGEADVREVLGNHEDVNAIVTLSAWNMTSEEAVTYGRDRAIGVFTWKKFFGAINYRKYWLYEELAVGNDASKISAERRRRRVDWN